MPSPPCSCNTHAASQTTSKPPQGGWGRRWPAKRSNSRECDCTPRRRVGGGQKGSFRFDAIQDSTLEFFPSCCLSACRGRCDTTVHYSTNSPKGSQSSLQWCANRLPAQVSPGSSKQQHLGTFTYGQQCSSYFLPCSILCYGSGRRMEQNPDSFKEWHYAYETLDVKIDVWIQEQEERKR